MNISEIETALVATDSQVRLKAITELSNYAPEIAIPLLLSKKQDPEFLVRSFVAMGLGKKQSAESFAALLEMVKFDRDSNVRAEAANSLSLFGQVSVPHLVLAFYQDDNWLVRRSILAALVELDCPEELLNVCVCGIAGEDLSVQETAMNALGLLAGTSQEKAALEVILSHVNHPSGRVRVQVALSLRRFNHPQADLAIEKLKQDEDYRVVGAALEKSLP